MFICIKYGNNEEAMVNINCKIINLLRYLKNFPKTANNDLELCDITGEVKNLQENRDKYANAILKEKERYILLIIDNEKTEKPMYTPLLYNDSIISKDFLGKLNSIVKTKTSKISIGSNLAKVAKVINPLTKNSKRNSQVQMINESENVADD